MLDGLDEDAIRAQLRVVKDGLPAKQTCLVEAQWSMRTKSAPTDAGPFARAIAERASYAVSVLEAWKEYAPVILRHGASEAAVISVVIVLIFPFVAYFVLYASAILLLVLLAVGNYLLLVKGGVISSTKEGCVLCLAAQIQAAEDKLSKSMGVDLWEGDIGEGLNQS